MQPKCQGMAWTGLGADPHRLRPAGFNAVRLPFSFNDLQALPPRDFRRALPRPSDREIAASVLPPGIRTRTSPCTFSTSRHLHGPVPARVNSPGYSALFRLPNFARCLEPALHRRALVPSHRQSSLQTRRQKTMAARRRAVLLGLCPKPWRRRQAGVALPEGAAIPPLPAPPPPGALCNDYLPSDSTMSRFLAVAAFYAANGFYVLLDNHLREDRTAVEDPARWAQLWAQLVRRRRV